MRRVGEEAPRRLWIGRARPAASGARRWRASVLLTCGLASIACPRGEDSGLVEPPSAADRRFFVERGSPVFVHLNGASGELYFPELVGAGGGLFDYDGDGDLDLFAVQGGGLGPMARPEGVEIPRDRLFRNDGSDDEGAVRLLDVTAASGLRSAGYGMGVATGDYDNDGAVDLYVTNFGANQLWRNEGDGTFRDVTAESGTGERRWSTSAAFVDLDADGWLDLVIANYTQYRIADNIRCTSPAGRPDYCHPLTYAPETDVLYRNLGDGTFEDVSGRAGMLGRPGNGLGVVAADVDGDGRLDVYVANDEQPNHLWRNLGEGRLVEEALTAGVAVNIEGAAEASMGLVAADLDADGDEDLFLTHLSQQTNTLYVNSGAGQFEDRSRQSGLGQPSLDLTGFGAAALDVENDGRPDLVVANGAVRLIELLASRGDPFPFHQPNQLFRNLGGGRFEEVPRRLAGSPFELSEVSRGLAVGDVDNDGDEDAVIFNNGGPLRLLCNEVGQRGHWLGVRAIGSATVGRRPLLGTRVGVATSLGAVTWRRVRTEGSYCSARDPRVVIGLGAEPSVGELRLEWPDGTATAWRGLRSDRYVTAAPRERSR